MPQEPAKKVEVVGPVKGSGTKNLDAWMEAVERVDTMSMGEIAAFVFSGIPGGEEAKAAFHERIRGYTQKEYELFADRMNEEKKTAGEVVLVLHHMLAFALARVIKKGLVQEPEEMRRILARVKFQNALAEIEGFLTFASKKKDGE